MNKNNLTFEQKLKSKIERECKKISKLEGEYFSNIQYPPTWIETSVKDLKQDVNSARRKACYDHHSWGVYKGIDYASENLLAPLLIYVYNSLECRTTFHRLGGLDDCEPCKLKLKLEQFTEE